MSSTVERSPGQFRTGLALIGYRGSGKSTIGRLLAARLGWTFADSDTLIEAEAGRPISSLFREFGELHFRDIEAQVIAQATTQTRLVLSTGGGAVLRDSNRALLRQFGLVVWLTASPEVLVARLRKSPGNRPALTNAGLFDEVSEVLQARTPIYRNLADLTVGTDTRNPAQVVDQILESLEKVWKINR